MAENIAYYDRRWNELWVDERKKVLANQEKESRETWDTSISVNCIMLFLYNPETGAIYVSKRADDKSENPGLFDKTVGGHVQAWTTFNDTVIDEVGGEIGIKDVQIISDISELSKIAKTANLTKTAIISQVGGIIQNYKSKRLTLDGTMWNKRMNVGLYIGIYKGDVTFVDKETQQMELIPISELRDAITNNPEAYTDDILKLIENHDMLSIIMKYAGKVDSILSADNKN